MIGPSISVGTREWDTFNRVEVKSLEDFLFTSQASSLLPIEAVPLGSRIATKNPKPWEFDDSFEEPDASWLKIGMTVVKANGSVVDVELLRPSDWLGEFALQEGARIDLKITELEVDGFATVTSIELCPPIAEGEGSVVIGRFATRRVDEIVTLVLRSESGREEELSGTSIHPIWSMRRNDWVPMGELDVGEVLLGHDESVTIIAKRIIQRPTPVYNIEVFGEHVYEVAALGVLVHNAHPFCTGGVQNRRLGPESYRRAHPEFHSTHEIHHAKEWNLQHRFPGIYSPAELNDLSNMRPIRYGQIWNGEKVHRTIIRQSWDKFEAVFKDRYFDGQITPEKMRALIERHVAFIDRMYLGG